MSGKLRTKIMVNCPEEFMDELKYFIDEIEDRVNKIKNNMNIKSIDQLSDIEIAFDDLNEFATDLY